MANNTTDASTLRVMNYESKLQKMRQEFTRLLVGKLTIPIDLVIEYNEILSQLIAEKVIIRNTFNLENVNVGNYYEATQPEVVEPEPIVLKLMTAKEKRAAKRALPEPDVLKEAKKPDNEKR